MILRAAPDTWLLLRLRIADIGTGIANLAACTPQMREELHRLVTEAE